MGSKQYGSSFGSVIVALILVFLAFVVVIVLMFQADTLDTNFLFGAIFGVLLVVLFGGYLIGKYVEKMRNERQLH